MTLEQILQSNAFIKDGSAITFKQPADYIMPFIDIVGKLTNNFDVQVSGRIANNNEELGVQESFPRVSVVARLPNHTSREHHYTIGIVYALEIGKPVMKVFHGPRADACLNLAIFNSRQVHSAEFLSGLETIYTNVKSYTEKIENELRAFEVRYDQMINTTYEGTKLDAVIGRLLFESLINAQVGSNPILSASKDLINPKSVYFANENKTTEWNVYSAVTDYVTTKTDILDKPTKTVLISQIFDKLHNN